MLRFKSILLLLTAFALSSCEMNAISSESSFNNGSITSSFSEESHSSNDKEKLKPFKVYDYYLDDSIPEPFSFTLDEFDDKTFCFDEKRRITNEAYGTVVSPASAVYVFDANNDGYRDFCLVNSDGSGVIYWYVTIYDLHNQKEIFRHWERLRYSYFLELIENNLYVRQVNVYYSDETINKGKISFDKTKGVYIDWNKNYDIIDFDVKITYADPKHTPLTFTKQKDDYHVIVDGVSQYFFDIDIHTNVDYGEEYLPVSFAMPNNRFSLSRVSKTNSIQRYCFFFTDNSGPECTTLITVSNITKAFIFSVRSSGPYSTLGDVISWSKDISLENMTKFEYEHESTLSALPSSSRHIYRFYDRDAFSKAIANFNQVAFEISPDDFGFLTDDFQFRYTYRFYVDEQMYSYQAFSNFVEFNGKWYKERTVFEVYSSSKESERLYAFPSNTEEVPIYNSLDETETGKSANYLSDLLFEEATAQANIKDDAKYYFVINNTKYYILSPKTFAYSAAVNSRIYTIVSDKDFSSLF